MRSEGIDAVPAYGLQQVRARHGLNDQIDPDPLKRLIEQRPDRTKLERSLHPACRVMMTPVSLVALASSRAADPKTPACKMPSGRTHPLRPDLDQHFVPPQECRGPGRIIPGISGLAGNLIALPFEEGRERPGFGRKRLFVWSA